VSHLHSLQFYTPIFHSWHLHVFTLRNLTANCMPPHSLRNFVNWTVIEDEVTLRLTASQSVSLGVEPHLLFDIYGLVFVGRPLWWEDGLRLFLQNGRNIYARSLSRVRVPWNSRQYFTVSDSRLPFLSPSTTRRVTVEVFDPASTQEWTVKSKSHCDWRSVSQ
jgi:hypothetical protein